jgi:hypothetical protein
MTMSGVLINIVLGLLAIMGFPIFILIFKLYVDFQETKKRLGK